MYSKWKIRIIIKHMLLNFLQFEWSPLIWQKPRIDLEHMPQPYSNEFLFIVDEKRFHITKYIVKGGQNQTRLNPLIMNICAG